MGAMSRRAFLRAAAAVGVSLAPAVALASGRADTTAGERQAVSGAAGASFSSDGDAPSRRAQAEAEVTRGTDEHRSFTLDNVLHASEGDVHFNLYVPQGYDPARLWRAWTLCLP